MPALAEARIAELLEPYLCGGEGAPLRLTEGALSQFATYLDLLLHWNERTNLTAIRQPEAIVQRHFGESVFVARHLGKVDADATLLDFGSGAGFPGLPIQIALTNLRVTLAESQGKKAAFLREAVRTLTLRTEVWGKRVEDMPHERHFNVVALRAVDKIVDALAAARSRIAADGTLAVIHTAEAAPAPSPGLVVFPMPGLQQGFLTLLQVTVPRGTRRI